MNIITAVDKNWAIGYENRLLNSIPEDMKFFRETTTGGIVVMGRRTLDSFPGGRPLKKRENIVLTRNPDFERDGVIKAGSLEEVLELTGGRENVYVIGGESVYRQLLPYCDTAYVTYMDYEYLADTWFPNLDQDPEWRLCQVSEEQTYFDIPYEFRVYKRK